MVKKLKLLLFIAFTTAIFACDNNIIIPTSSRKLNYPDTSNISRDFEELKNTKLRNAFFNWVNNEMYFDIKSIINCNQTTASHAGKLPDYFYKPNYKGLYGTYYLMGDKIEVGTMYVYEPDSIPGWNCSDNREEFISYFISDTTGLFDDLDLLDDINLYNDITLGMNKKKLFDKIGKPYQIYMNKIIYHDFNNTIAIFDIYKNSVLSIQVGKYNIEWDSDTLIKTSFIDKILREENVHH